MSARLQAALALVLLAAFALAPLPAAAAPPGPASGAPGGIDNCRKCHVGQAGKPGMPARMYGQDIHAERGITCAGCHGGDPTAVDESGMDPDKGFRGAPARTEIVALCASCHTNPGYLKRFDPRPYIFSMDEFRTSVHGQRAAVDPKVATCISCHSVHDIRPPTDPTSTVFPENVPRTCAHCHNPAYMKGYGIPTNQYALYLESVHGRALLEKHDLSAPACNDCHGNHGAAPPGVANIVYVCGSCHGREGDLFRESPMKLAMDHMPTARGCVTCHGNHGVQRPTDAFLSAAPGGACARCHEPGSVCAVATDSIIGGIGTLSRRLANADSLLGVAEVRGMDAAQGRDKLRDARDQLVGARAMLHSFDQKKITAALAEGLSTADAARANALEALRDYRVRRLGLVVALAVILLIIVALTVKIRSLDRGRARAGPPAIH